MRSPEFLTSGCWSRETEIHLTCSRGSISMGEAGAVRGFPTGLSRCARGVVIECQRRRVYTRGYTRLCWTINTGVALRAIV